MEGLCSYNNGGASDGSTPCCTFDYGDFDPRGSLRSILPSVARSENAQSRSHNRFMPFTSSHFYWAMMIAGIGESMIGETRTEPKIEYDANLGQSSELPCDNLTSPIVSCVQKVVVREFSTVSDYL